MLVGPASPNAVMAPKIDLADSATLIERSFQQRFGRGPAWIAAAPGRVNLIGEHTDYNDGFVLPMAIERYVVAAAAPAQAGESGAESPGDAAASGAKATAPFPPISLVSTAAAEPERFRLGDCDFRQLAPWARYVYGVLMGCREHGFTVPAMNVLIDSTVPLGGGLSSSAALEVAIATLIEAIAGRRLDPIAKALLCQKAEHEYAGVPCGIMDQFSSVFGQTDQLLLLDCRSRRLRMAPLADPEIEVLIINTNVKRELSAGEYARRRSECQAAASALGVASLRDATPDMLDQNQAALDPTLLRRARHVIGENARTLAAADCMTAGRWPELGRLMYASHASLRDDYEVSCTELDLLVQLARESGDAGAIIGSRMTGGGFGGCTVSLVRRCHLAQAAASIAEEYRRRTGIEPTIFTTRPAQGAQILRGLVPRIRIVRSP